MSEPTAPRHYGDASESPRRLVSYLAWTLAIAGLYFIIARLSVVFAAEPEHVSVVWPPSGFALAALLLTRRRTWPLLLSLIGIGSVIANLARGSTIAVSLGFSAANTLEPFAAALVFLRIATIPGGIRSRREVGALAIASVVGPALAGLVGAATVAINLGAPYWQTWRVWWIADAIGTLIVGAIILVAAAGRKSIPDLSSRWRLGEAVALASSLIAVTTFSFGIAPAKIADFFHAYMVFPCLLWAGLRFSSMGAATSIVILTAISVPLTLAGLGTFADVSPSVTERMLALQVYLGTASLAALTAAASFNERRQAESALSVALGYNRGLIEASRNPLFTSDVTGKIRDVNPAAESLFGRHRRELIGTDVAQYFADSEGARAGIRGVLAQGSVTDYPMAVRDATGGLTQMRFTVTVLRDEDGAVAGIFGTGRDVTEQRRAEREAGTAREVMQLSLSTTSVDEFMRQLPGVLSRCLDVPVVQIATYDPVRDEMAPGPSVGLPAPDSMEGAPTDVALIRISAPLIAPGGRVLGTLTLGDAPHRPDLAQSRPTLEAIAGNIAEILERERVQAELRESEARYRTLFAQNLTPMLLIDPAEGAIVDANSSAADYYGWDVPTLRTMHIRAINLLSPEQLRARMDLVATGRTRHFEARHRLASGELRDVEVFSGRVTMHGRSLLLSTIHDITDRKRAEAALRASEEKFRLLAENISDVIWVLDIEAMRFRYVSPSVERLRGYTASEAMEEDIGDSLMPGSLQLVQRLIPERLARARTGLHESFVDEVEQPCRNGSTVWVETTTHFTQNPDTEHWEVYGVSRNVTARRRAEEALRKSEAATQQLFDEMISAFIVFDVIFDDAGNPTNCRFIRGNPAFERMTGLRLNETVGKTLDELVIGWPPELVRRFYDVAITGVPIQYERYNATLDVHVETRVFSPTRGQFAHVFNNVNARKRAETLLQQSEERLRLIIEGSHDAAWDWDVVSSRVYYSPRWWSMLGYEVDELPNDADLWRRLAHPDDAHITLGQVLDGARQTGSDTFEFELRLRHKDGHYVPELVRGSILRDGDRRAVRCAGTTTDLTERKKAEAALRASLHEQAALLKEVHHRVKNNLQVIASLLRLEAGRVDNAGTKAALAEMNGRIQAMASLHETIYRSDSWAQVNLADYFKQLATEVFRAMAGAHGGIRLRLDVSPICVEMNQAIPCGLIVNELVSNCLKHGFPDRRTGEVSVELHRQGGTPLVRLRVSDTGVGLPANFDLAHTRTLGVHLVADLARQLQGTLEIGPGPGATFAVSFALREQAPALLP